MIPYGRQTIEAEDEAAVLAVLRGDYLTTGPAVERFETAFAGFCGAAEAVAVSSGTAALHLALLCLDLAPDDEVIVPPLTFCATVNAVLYAGARPVFADIDADTLLIDPACVEAKIGPRTRAVIGVDYAGQPCDWTALRALADIHGLTLIADACHAPGARHAEAAVGTCADLNTFSFHPVKHLTTAEGGAITLEDPARAARLRRLRSHGVDKDFRARAEGAQHGYDLVELGFNYRLSDLQSALGLAQLARLPAWIDQRRHLAARYDAALANNPGVEPLGRQARSSHAYHLYVIRTKGPLQNKRDGLFAYLRAQDIGVVVHYPLVLLMQHYRRTQGTGPGLCPVAEAVGERVLSIPLYPSLRAAEQDRVIAALDEAASALCTTDGERV